MSGHMLDLEEDEDLEVFTKVKIKTQLLNIHWTRPAAATGLQTSNLRASVSD